MTAATATATASALPHLQDEVPSRHSTPPPPPSRAIPTDFRSSLSAWWGNSSFKEARIAEERLLRRMSVYTPPTPQSPEKGWFSWSGGSGSGSGSAHDASLSSGPSATATATATASAADAAAVADRAGEQVVNDTHAVPPVSLPGTGLVATLRNVFIPTPDPSLSPAHPADPRIPTPSPTASPSTSTDSLDHDGKKKHKSHHGLHLKHHGHGHGHSGKLVDYINTIEISRPEDANSKEAVVVLHGYAAALGFFFRNWESIAQSSASTSRRTFFLDWLGMGLSSRPSPSLLSAPTNASAPARVARAEHFFLSSLESWRQSVGVDKMVLVGHSLGGYLASAYAVRYPERVSSLILVSPAGVPRGPEYKKFPLSAELDGKDGLDKVEMEAHSALAEEGEAGKRPEPVGEAKQWQQNRDQSAFRRGAQKFFIWGWDRGWSPFSILRSIGPWGPMLVGRYSARRFAAQSEEDVRDLHSYIWNTSVMKGSGEYCITHILAPGAHARVPIIDRIDKVKVPVTFLYGDNDWMDVQGGRDSLELLKKAGNSKSSVHVIPKAGHHLYLDNPETTNRILDEAIKAVPVSSS